MVDGRGGLGKTRLLEEVPRLLEEPEPPRLDAAVVKARALALVEVERRPAGDGRAAWSIPPCNLRPRARGAPDGLHVAGPRDIHPLPPRRGQNLSFS